MNTILDRKLGSSYPISIPTSLALETIGRPLNSEEGHVIPGMPIPLTKYGVFTISINTLIKNLISSINPATLPRDNSSIHNLIMDQVDQEIMVIQEVVKKHHPNMIIQPYVNNFGVFMILLAKLKKQRRFSGKTGEKEKLYYHSLMVAITKGYKVYNSYVNMRLIQPGSKVLCLTSFPTDMVGNERAINVLEPHTGVVRTYDTFYKKFYKMPNTDMSVIPFNIITHILFGDKHMILPDNIKIRRDFIKIAEENGFLYNTQKKTMLDAIYASEFKDLKLSINRFKNL